MTFRNWLNRRRQTTTDVERRFGAPPPTAPSLPAQPGTLGCEILDDGEMPELHSADIVGESHHQNDLWEIIGGHRDRRVREEVIAVFVPEPTNTYDPQAVAVYVVTPGGGTGRKAGHLGRNDAARLHETIATFCRQRGKAPALHACITGGGPATPHLGVFITH